MSTIDGAILDFKRLDLLASGDTGLHRLDAKAKVIVTAVFVLLVISHDRYELSALFPFFIFPAAMIAAGNLPFSYIARKILLLCPFVIVVGIFNPLIDRTVILHAGPLAISGGWLSFFSIITRSILTVGSAFILLALTGFTGVCQALEELGMPRPFAVQLLFLYRYIFVLTEEGGRAARARQLRSCGKKGMGMGSFGTLIGHLLLRTWQRAERVHIAMLSRGFDGRFHSGRQSSFGMRELIFVAGWSSFLITLRFMNITQIIGSLVTGRLY
ncbi:MAG TPA: cobalt ECF transporter T component CbiQ [Geobacteraceae bacterium]|nr:cobalt ECF transporter T component CbiQ [Geobacteraceae bacterium]